MRFVALFLLLPYLLLAQATGWQALTISDGLSQGMIFDLTQDRSGFIWVTTKDGLNRYDGHTFRVFTHDPDNPYSLSDNSCTALLLDRQGRLWIGTLSHGLNLYDERTERFYHVDIADQGAPHAGNYEIQVLREDPDGSIWAGTNQGRLFRLTLPTALKTGFPNRPDFTSQVQQQSMTTRHLDANGYARAIDFRPNGQGVAVTPTGLFAFNWRTPTRAVPLLLAGKTRFTSFALMPAPRTDTWFAATPQWILAHSPGGQHVVRLPHTTDSSINLIALDARTVAVVTNAYLWLLSPDELMQRDSLTPANALTTMPPNVYGVTNLLRARSGNIWVGTSGYGLRRFNPRVRQFRLQVAGKSLGYLLEDQRGRRYVRHELAYQAIDPSTGQLRPFLSSSLPPPDHRQRYMMQDKRGYFWVSNVNFITHAEHLLQFSPDWQLLHRYALPIRQAFGFMGNQTIEDRDGQLWIGATDGRLLRFDPATETFRVYSYRHLLPPGGATIETYTLYFDHAGVLWAGTQQGLIRITNPLTNPTFTVFRSGATRHQRLSNDFVSGVIDDPVQPTRYLWVSTKGGGLNRYDRLTGLFRHVTEAQGLPNRVVYGLLADGQNYLWMSTNRGLAQLNPRTFQIRQFTKSDGLQDDEFNTGSLLKTATGELLFGGINGLTAFRPAHVTGHSGSHPRVRIIGLRINNEPIGIGQPDGVLIQAIDHTRHIDLRHDQNLVTLDFSLMDFTNSAGNRYRYRLAGLDKDWVDAGNQRFANYAHLPDGRYTFYLVGSADGQIWSPPVQLSIRVKPPLYRSWWAYLAYALLLAGLVWQLYRFQTQRLLLQQQVAFEQQEASRLAELDALKTRFFANISHEFRTPLTLILGPAEEAVRDYATDPRFPLIQQNATRLLSLINQLLDLNKLDAGQLRPVPEPGDLAAFFRMIGSAFYPLADSRQVSLTIQQNCASYWARFDHDKLEKIVTNLLANAIKFTTASQTVCLTVAYPAPTDTPRSLILTVADTGTGIAAVHLPHIFERFYQVDGPVNRLNDSTGIGLALVSELVGVLGGTIGVTSTEAVGTTFTMHLPVDPVDAPASPSLAGSHLSDHEPGALATPEPAEAGAGTDTLLLIIDDNADIRAYLRLLLAPTCRSLEATDGQEGLELATRYLPDLIICDLMMPRLDGFAFCQQLKTQSVTSHIPVMMLTARAGTEDRLEGFELGADAYLTKPFSRAEVQVRLRNLLQKQARLQAYFSNRPPVGDPITAPVALKPEAIFLEKARQVVLDNLSQSQFGVDTFCLQMGMSQSQLVRKLKALTGQTAVEFIRHVRLRQAADRLRRGDGTVSEIAYAVGFESLSYFTRAFQAVYGVLPSTLLSGNGAATRRPG